MLDPLTPSPTVANLEIVRKVSTDETLEDIDGMKPAA